jgi:DHA2 family lincomycin resistance protein-like MFS transporter
VSTATWVAFAVGAVGLAAFVARQLVLQRLGHPLLDLRTFRSRTFTAASLIMMVMFGLLLGTAVLLPIFMQSVQGLTPLATGLLLLPGGVVMGLLGPVVGRLYDRFGALVPLVPGALVACAAMWSATLFSADSSPVRVLVFHVLLSVGLAFTFTPLFTAGLGDLPPRLYSFGSAIFSASQQLAGAAGVALLVSVYSLRAASLTGVPEPERIADGLHVAFLVAAALSVLAVVGSVFVRTPASPPGPPGGNAPKPE